MTRIHDLALSLDCPVPEPYVCGAKAGHYCSEQFVGDDPDAPQFHIARVIAAVRLVEVAR